MNFIAARSLPHRSIGAVYQKYNYPPILRLPPPPSKSGEQNSRTPNISSGWESDRRQARGKNGAGERRRDLYNQSNIVDKSSARNPSAKINYGRLPGFGQRAIRIPHTRASSSPPLILHTLLPIPLPSPLRPVDAPPGRLHPHPWHPPSSSPTSTLRLPSCKTNSRPFFCSVARIYIYICILYILYIYSALLLRGGACSTPRKRRPEAAVACSVGSAFWTTSGRSMCVCRRLVRWVVAHVGGWGPEQRGGGGCSVAWVDVARSAPGFAGNFFSSEFSKGNDLRYISKGFLLVGKRVRRSAIYPPTEGRLARSRGLPDNLHFSTINLTFVRLFFCGQSDWPYVREDSLSSFPSL